MVCVGNICRSPMAVALLRRQFAGRDITIESSGLAAMSGHPVDAMAEVVLARHSLSMDAHVARQIKQQHLLSADLVLGMEQRHMAALRALEPRARSKMALLGKWQDDAEVADPYGRDLAFFERTFMTIETLAGDWTQRLD